MNKSNQQEDTLLYGKYRILRTIGQGGFGRTFLAEDASVHLERRCVIKQFFATSSNSDQAAELFRLEAQRLEELGNHPQIPKLLEYFETVGNQDDTANQYIAQEFIDGQNLEQELAQDGVFTEAEIRSLLNDLLPVLQFVHDRQVIHRDIKPANIIRRRDRQLFLVDFGAAKFGSQTVLAKTGTSIGSAEYIAPEQLMGKAVFQSDLYSLGVTCIYLLTQMPPFELMDSSEGIWVWRDYLTQPVSQRLGQILDKMLERRTRKRYQSAVEILQDLSGTLLSTLLSTSVNHHKNIWDLPRVRTVVVASVVGVVVAGAINVVGLNQVKFSEPINTPPTVQIPSKQEYPTFATTKPSQNPHSFTLQATDSSVKQSRLYAYATISLMFGLLIVVVSFGVIVWESARGNDFIYVLFFLAWGVFAVIVSIIILV